MREVLQLQCSKDSLLPRHVIAEQTLLDQLSIRMYDKPLRQLENAVAVNLQTQIEQMMIDRQWEHVARSGRKVYEAPIVPKLDGLREVLADFLQQRSGRVYASNFVREATIYAYDQSYVLNDRNRSAFAEMIAIMQQALRDCHYAEEAENNYYSPLPLTLPDDVEAQIELALASVERVATNKGGVIACAALREAITTVLGLERVGEYHYDELFQQHIQHLLKAAGFRPKTQWLAPNQFVEPPTSGCDVFLPSVFLEQVSSNGEDAPWIAIKRTSDTDSFPVLAPVCIVDEREQCIIALRMVGHPEAVRANYARIMSSSNSNGFRLAGSNIRQSGLKQHKLVKAQLPMGLLDYFLIHKQASAQTMQGGKAFYVLDDRQQTVPPLFMPLLDRAIDTPTQAHWAAYLWRNGIAVGLVVPANESGIGLIAWSVEAEQDAWRDLISEGVRLGAIALHDADGKPIAGDATALPIISSYSTEQALDGGVLIAASGSSAGVEHDGFARLQDIVVETTFPLGRIVYTNGIQAEMEDGNIDPLVYLKRHSQQDWGDEMDEHDRQVNAQALRDEHRLLSAYETDSGKIFVITEWDRSVTTVLFASEY